MRTLALATLTTFALAVAACGPPSEPAEAPAGPSTAAASASPSATPSAAPTASPSPATTVAEAPTPPKPAKPQRHFWDYDGPAEGPTITGKRAWTAVPDGKHNDRYRHVFISVEDFVKSDATQSYFTAPYGDISVPRAMAENLAPPASLKKGDPIMAESSNDSAIARVLAVEGATVKMKYVFGDLAGDLEAPLSEVVLLDGTLRLGTPVAFKQDAKWFAGRLLAKTAQDAWVALHYTDNQPYAKVKPADLRPLDLKKVFKVGDPCLADSSYITKNELLPAKVTRVIEDGLFYEVKADKGGATWTIPLNHISAPLK